MNYAKEMSQKMRSGVGSEVLPNRCAIKELLEEFGEHIKIDVLHIKVSLIVICFHYTTWNDSMTILHSSISTL
jgi:hypothetical protein